MTNKEKYDNCFVTGLGIDLELVNSNLKYNGIRQWGSLRHMELVVALEEAFLITFDTLDVFDLNSYDKGFEILRRYGVDI